MDERNKKKAVVLGNENIEFGCGIISITFFSSKTCFLTFWQLINQDAFCNGWQLGIVL